MFQIDLRVIGKYIVIHWVQFVFFSSSKMKLVHQYIVVQLLRYEMTTCSTWPKATQKFPKQTINMCKVINYLDSCLIFCWSFEISVLQEIESWDNSMVNKDPAIIRARWVNIFWYIFFVSFLYFRNTK